MHRTVKKNFHFELAANTIAKTAGCGRFLRQRLTDVQYRNAKIYDSVTDQRSRRLYTPGDLDTGHGSLNVRCHSSINLSKFLSRFIVRRMHA